MLNYLDLKCETCGESFKRYDKTHERNLRMGHHRVFCSKSCSLQGNKRACGEGQRVKAASSFEDRFWERVNKTDFCWVWTGGKNQRGYGVCRRVGAKQMAHRISYEMQYGVIPDGQLVLHTCDNRACVNPKHLVLGDHKQNMRDRDSKGRQAKGSASFHAKLSEEDVREIRRSDKSHSELAKKYGVAPFTIYAAKTGRTWRHL